MRNEKLESALARFTFKLPGLPLPRLRSVERATAAMRRIEERFAAVLPRLVIRNNKQEGGDDGTPTD